MLGNYRTARGLLARHKPATITLGGFLGALLLWIGNYQILRDLVHGADRLMANPSLSWFFHSNLFALLCLFGVAASLWFIGRAANRQSESAALAEQAKIEAFEAKIGKLPYLMTKAMILGRDIDALEKFIASYASAVDKKKEELAPYFSDELIAAPRSGGLDWNFFSSSNLTPNLTSFEIDCRTEALEADKVTPSRHADDSPLKQKFGYGCFDPAQNKPFIAAQKRNLAKVEARLSALRGVAERQKKELVTQRNAIELEITSRGYGK